MDSFYVILPSNTPTDTGEKNKSSMFTVRLPDTLALDSNWTVALSSIIYPMTFASIGSEERPWIRIYYENTLEKPNEYPYTKNTVYLPAITPSTMFDLEAALNNYIFHHVKEPRLYKIYITDPSAYDGADKTLITNKQINDIVTDPFRGKEFKDYKSIEGLTDQNWRTYHNQMMGKMAPAAVKEYFLMDPKTGALDSQAALNRYKGHEWSGGPLFYLIFDATLNRFRFMTNNTRIKKYEMSPELAYVLGFKSTEMAADEVASYYPDFTAGFKHLYIYAPGLVENSIVGNQHAPILRVVNVKGSFGESVEAIYSQEHHHKLASKRISEVTIEVRSHGGKLLKFNSGNTIVTLHFQRNLF